MIADGGLEVSLLWSREDKKRIRTFKLKQEGSEFFVRVTMMYGIVHNTYSVEY